MSCLRGCAIGCSTLGSPEVSPIPLESLDAALDREGPIVIALSPFDPDLVRTTIRARCPILLVEVATGVLTETLAALRPHVEILIDRLVQIEDLVVGQDLQQVLDVGVYNPRLGSLFELLWTARFERREGRDPTHIVKDLWRLTFDEASPLLRNDAVLFWLSLLRQNDSPAQVILIVTSATGFDPDMQSFVRAAEHWASLGAPLRIVTDTATVS